MLNSAHHRVAALALIVIAGTAAGDDLVPPPYRGEPLSLTAAWEFGMAPVNPNFIPPDSIVTVGAEGFRLDLLQAHAELQGAWSWTPGDGNGGLTPIGGPGSSFGIAFKLPNQLPPQAQMALRVQVTYQWPQAGIPNLQVTLDSVERLPDKPPGPTTLIGFPGMVTAVVPIDETHFYQDWIVEPSWHFTDLQMVVPFGVVLDEVVIDTITLPSTPLNDACEDAIKIGDGVTPFSTLGATDDGPDLPAECDEGFGTELIRDIWYEYTPTCSGALLITACNPDTNYDARLAVYTGPCDALQLVACSDDVAGCPVLDLTGVDLLPTVEFDAACGTTYRIRLGGYPGPEQTGSGTGSLSVICLGGHTCVDSCPADLNGNGTVDGADLGILLASWGPCPRLGNCPSDFNGDEDVDGADLGILLSAWGPCPPLCPPSDHNCYETGILCCITGWDELCVAEAEALCDGCGNPQAGDCCQPNGTPFCDQRTCCELVCQIDPECCKTAWDVECAALAITLPECDCPILCPPSDHNCYETGIPGCTDLDCCIAVCQVEPFCCTVAWDEICVEIALDVCVACGQPGSGPCCVANGSPTCEDQLCCELVCAQEPFCCTVEWDGLCAEIAATFSSCGCSGTICPPSDHDCFTTGLPGCSDVPCCEQVCAVEPLCCTESWDLSCVDLAEQVCIGGFCGDPTSGDCCTPNGTPYCTNETCCEQICTVDSFCCATAWDQVCAEQAQVLLDCNCE